MLICSLPEHILRGEDQTGIHRDIDICSCREYYDRRHYHRHSESTHPHPHTDYSNNVECIRQGKHSDSRQLYSIEIGPLILTVVSLETQNLFFDSYLTAVLTSCIFSTFIRVQAHCSTWVCCESTRADTFETAHCINTCSRRWT